MNQVPLVVDLDGTLLRSDTLFETWLSVLKASPLTALASISWVAKGKAFLKQRLAEESEVDVALLPFNSSVLEMMHSASDAGRPVVLATATHKIYADRIAAYLGGFADVIATEDDVNLSSHRKRDVLVARYGSKGFDYIGNSHDDIAVWKEAREVHIVEPHRGVVRKASENGDVHSVTAEATPKWRTWVKALRLHQWIKNLLIFVPLLASHRLAEVPMIGTGILAFIAFGLCASSVYVLNDLLDLADDRQHTTKRNRPFAAGKLEIKHGLFAVPILLLLAFGLAALFLPLAFSLALVGYYIVTLLYSLWLKRQMMVDVVTLGVLYTCRIIAGALAFQIALTFWMLAFSMFMFLSLALVKRYAELGEARRRGKEGQTRGRGYFPDDLEMISSLGAASGYIAVMVLALYIQEQNIIALYRHPEVLWLSCPLLLFWISRTWMLTHRGEMHDDPIVFAVKDRVSLVVGALFGIIFWIAT
ncbi:UbiA family prenyltransferase [Schauerella aestuarii]|uniref:UbiA family prenyltransferase n=1 Tax=Schauerella aestuarii TaxID=2511204 RepID=UPI00136ADE86|nr:UbiA family prenyltransferase [Achromobacter aestuarii]MYZ43679.1 UbiA family prenyltransferase [Achromobacter aestuarii]